MALLYMAYVLICPEIRLTVEVNPWTSHQTDHLEMQPKVRWTTRTLSIEQARGDQQGPSAHFLHVSS